MELRWVCLPLHRKQISEDGKDSRNLLDTIGSLLLLKFILSLPLNLPCYVFSSLPLNRIQNCTTLKWSLKQAYTYNSQSPSAKDDQEETCCWISSVFLLQWEKIITWRIMGPHLKKIRNGLLKDLEFYQLVLRRVLGIKTAHFRNFHMWLITQLLILIILI